MGIDLKELGCRGSIFVYLDIYIYIYRPGRLIARLLRLTRLAESSIALEVEGYRGRRVVVGLEIGVGYWLMWKAGYRTLLSNKQISEYIRASVGYSYVAIEELLSMFLRC